jgi:hypothetical protein
MPGHPRLGFTEELGLTKKEDVDARDKPGHDGIDMTELNKTI